MIIEEFKSQELIKGAFGLYGRFPVFFLNEKPAVNEEQYYTSAIGTPVWDRIKLKSSADAENLNYVDRAGITNVMNALTLPDTVLVEASQGKDIVKTKMTGSNGTAKEEISLDDWEITIRGVIINYKNNDYPRREVASMVTTFTRPLECYVESKYLNNVLKVFNLMIEKVVFNAVPGRPNTQSFELTCTSDIPIIFDLRKL
jgi:hypothetical protein